MPFLNYTNYALFSKFGIGVQQKKKKKKILHLQCGSLKKIKGSFKLAPCQSLVVVFSVFFFFFFFVVVFLPVSVAQLDARPIGDQEVAGSTPAGSATFFLGD